MPDIPGFIDLRIQDDFMRLGGIEVVENQGNRTAVPGKKGEIYAAVEPGRSQWQWSARFCFWYLIVHGQNENDSYNQLELRRQIVTH